MNVPTPKYNIEDDVVYRDSNDDYWMKRITYARYDKVFKSWYYTFDNFKSSSSIREEYIINRIN